MESGQIVVEEKEFETSLLWAGMQKSDGFVNKWIFKTSTGSLVQLAKPRGELMMQFKPHAWHLLEKHNEQGEASDR